MREQLHGVQKWGNGNANVPQRVLFLGALRALSFLSSSYWQLAQVEALATFLPRADIRKVLPPALAKVTSTSAVFIAFLFADAVKSHSVHGVLRSQQLGPTSPACPMACRGSGSR